jgi:hypothetical protein
MGSMGIFAQSWTIDGSVSFYNYAWEVGSFSETTRTASLSITAGKYITSDLNIGLRGGFSMPENGLTISAGPRIKYDFFKYEKTYFAVSGGLSYVRYVGSYSLNNNYPENDANRLFAILSPSVHLRINNNIEVYWQFAELYYHYTWLTLKGTKEKVSTKLFQISGPFGEPTFGWIFRF